MVIVHLAARCLAPPSASAVARSGIACRLPMLCRTVACQATAAPLADEQLYTFNRAPCDAPIFPELLQPGRRAVLLAVDPDLQGAVAAVSWLNPPAADNAAPTADGTALAPIGSPATAAPFMNGSLDGVALEGGKVSGGALPLQQAVAQLQQQAILPPLDQLAVELHDMPLEIWEYGSRNKRQPDAGELIAILQRYADMATGGPAFGLHSRTVAFAAEDLAAAAAKPKGRRRKKDAVADSAETAAAAAAAAAATAELAAESVVSALLLDSEPPVVRAVVEYSLPAHVSGKYAWYGIGFSVGLLNGLLAAQHIPYHRVHSSTWKRAMGLTRQGKGGSIALARHLLPSAARFLTRKKDHGRAEALLIAAWALGIRMERLGNGTSSGSETEAGGADDSSEELELE